jgi:glycosyltransferase involved in cell wall biosynthesis
MDKRNILYISYYFPPMGLSGVQRTTKFVKYLPDYGWKPHVLTITPESFYAFDGSLMDDFDGRDIQIHRTASKSKKRGKVRKFPSYFVQKTGRFILNFVFQPDSKIRWKKSALELGKRIIEENDIQAIIATAPPFTDFLIAHELSDKFDIPFIIDYRDSWVDNPFHYYPTPFHKNYSLKLEDKILKYANHIVVITRQEKEKLLQKYKYISHQDISIIPHGYDPDDFNQYGDVQPNPEKFTLTHSGVFQDDRTPKYFLRAVASFLKKNPQARNKIELRFIGVMRKSHLKLIKKTGLENNVVTTGYVSHNEAVKNLLESDVLWLTLNDTHRTPGKLYEYFGARKPVLICSPDGIMRKTALASESAIAAGPKDEAGIENAIKTFYELWQNNSLPQPSEEFAAQFDRKMLTGELSKIVGLSLDI